MDGISFQLFHKELDEINILCQRLSYSRVLSLIDEASSFQNKRHIRDKDDDDENDGF